MGQEFEFVKQLVNLYPRTPRQLNRPFDSDAEILVHGGQFLCVSIDTLSEEFCKGLIHDSKTLGWVSVTAAASNLAAVGVAPQSMAINVLRPKHISKSDIELLRVGAEEACRLYSCELSEWNVTSGSEFLTTATALASVAERPSLLRSPLQKGDLIYATGPLGWGNAVAFANLAIRPQHELWADQVDSSYRPKARIKESAFFKKWAQTCIDTSDGPLFALEMLTAVNNCGIEIFYSPEVFHPLALEVAKATQVDPWLFFAAQTGEYELFFSVTQAQEKDFLKAATTQPFQFIKLGQVTAEKGLSVKSGSRHLPLNLSPIENLLYQGVDAETYINALMKMAQDLQLGTP
jgi:thiamin-phosphate kinase